MKCREHHLTMQGHLPFSLIGHSEDGDIQKLLHSTNRCSDPNEMIQRSLSVPSIFLITVEYSNLRVLDCISVPKYLGPLNEFTGVIFV